MQAIHTLAAAIVVASLSFVAVIAQAQTHATKEEATAMVKKGVAFVKANGKQKGYAEITNKQGQFAFVGGGPNGVALANFLGAQGVRTLVVERSDEILPYPRAVGMDDEALRLVNEQIGTNDNLLVYRYIEKLAPNITVMLLPSGSPFLVNLDQLKGGAANPPQ